MSEAIKFSKHLITTDTPFARETVGCYNNVRFVHPTNVSDWCDAMSSAVQNIAPDHIRDDSQSSIKDNSLSSNDANYARNWDDLWRILLSKGRIVHD